LSLVEQIAHFNIKCTDRKKINKSDLRRNLAYSNTWLSVIV